LTTRDGTSTDARFATEKTYTDDEMIAAFAILLPPEREREEGLAYNALPDATEFESATPEELAASEAKGPRSYDGDVLDRLSLVSDSCAERAWVLVGITREDGERRGQPSATALTRLCGSGMANHPPKLKHTKRTR